jgi:hypothetical protein
MRFEIKIIDLCPPPGLSGDPAPYCGERRPGHKIFCGMLSPFPFEFYIYRGYDILAYHKLPDYELYSVYYHPFGDILSPE